MFTNLIESRSHAREIKRRSSFFAITVAVYAAILFAAGVASVYAYDAQLEAQAASLEFLSWVPPVAPDKPQRTPENHVAVARRPATARVDPHISVPIRTEGIARTDDPRRVPPNVGVQAPSAPPVTGEFRRGPQNLDPPAVAPSGTGGCLTCASGPPVVTIVEGPPEPAPVKPTTQRVPSVVLTSKAVSLPQPIYPSIARQTRTQGPVSVQILVDEQGRVVSAQSVAGSPLLTAAAKEAAMRARFTPTLLNGIPVKIQGVITYNFVLQ